MPHTRARNITMPNSAPAQHARYSKGEVAELRAKVDTLSAALDHLGMNSDAASVDGDAKPTRHTEATVV